MSLSEYRVFNVARFPAVWCCSESFYPGYGDQWQCELETWLALRQLFFLWPPSRGIDEKAADAPLPAK